MRLNDFYALEIEERKTVFLNTSRKLKMSEAIIEKDFWVCWCLKYLFHDFRYKDFICFKGGTSLSKVYHCIERFSEDIDLALDWKLLDISKEQVYENKSNRQQDFFNKKANEKTEDYLKNVWLPLMRADFSNLFHNDFNLYIEETDPQTICFQYPKTFEDASVLQIIRLEIGALAEPVPSSWNSMQAYIQDVYPNVIEDDVHVKTVDVCRTFFEKITILHREAYRTNGNYPNRYSRHYYDVYQLIENGTATRALQDLAILKMVVSFKKKFYPCNWARYDLVLQGGCKLVPKENAIAYFEKDYKSMSNMIYGESIPFETMMKRIQQYEEQLNKTVLGQIRMQG